jgi:hypothetical protein
MAKTGSRKQRVRELEREVAALRDDVVRLTTLHLRLQVELVEQREQIAIMHESHEAVAQRPEVDAALAHLVSNLADVRRHLATG